MQVCPPPDGVSLSQVAEDAKYTGSPYHRTRPVDGVRPVYKRGDSQCPKEIQGNPTLVREWLRESIRAGNVGRFDQGFPKLVWKRVGDRIFEARQGSPGSGEYHGYPLDPDEEVRGLA